MEKFKKIILLMIWVTLVAFSGQSYGSEEPANGNQTQYFGKIPPFHRYEIQEKGDKIWQFITQRLNISSLTPAPSVHFDAFVRETQQPEWTLWQKQWLKGNFSIWEDWFRANTLEGEKIEITQDWVEKNIDEIFPFPKTFLAFWYEGTPNIQINPSRTFQAGVQHNHLGLKEDLTGQGYYSLAHEMLHYALEVHGVRDSFIHHCLFVTKNPENQQSFMEELVDFMLQAGIAKSRAIFIKSIEIEKQRSPCERLSGDQIAKVNQFFSSSDPEILSTGPE